MRPIPAAGAVVVRDGSILLVRRGVEPLAGTWTVPGGRQRVGESLRETARRETLEETGIEVEVGDPAWVGDVIDPGGKWHLSIVDFHAIAVGGSLRAGDDAAEALWVPLDEAAGLVTTPGMRAVLASLAAKSPLTPRLQEAPERTDIPS